MTNKPSSCYCPTNQSNKTKTYLESSTDRLHHIPHATFRIVVLDIERITEEEVGVDYCKNIRKYESTPNWTNVSSLNEKQSTTDERPKHRLNA